MPGTSVIRSMAEKYLGEPVSQKLFDEVFQDVKAKAQTELAARASIKEFIKKRLSNPPPTTSDFRHDAEKQLGYKISKKIFIEILQECNKKRKADSEGPKLESERAS